MRGSSLAVFLGVAGLAVGLFLSRSNREPEGQVPGQAERPQVGDVVDELRGVKIYFNGDVENTRERRRSSDGYNYGLAYQCVEFVKRYYFDALGHRMPDTWGHAKDFFDREVFDGEVNAARGLLQFRNGGGESPAVDDLVVFGPNDFNPYGHVAIVSKVDDRGIEIAQQNPGPDGKSRVRLVWARKGGPWKLSDPTLLGWLRVSSGDQF